MSRENLLVGQYDRPALAAQDVTPQQQEQLVRLMEEAGELVQTVSKVLRWGWNGTNPEAPGETNRAALDREFCDVLKQYMRARDLGLLMISREEGRGLIDLKLGA